MTQIITFTNVIGVPDQYAPIPASTMVPEWYKDLESYTSGEKKPNGNAGTTATAKRCMPIFDAMTGGYLILTHADLFVSQKEEPDGKVIPFYEWANHGAISFHPKEQLPEHPDDTGHEVAYPKWNNTWGIKTPPGYSTLFIPPMHRENPIIALSGVVDTDTYNTPVNFPFVLRDPKMEGLIPAGTPIVQVIPFKRDSWKMEIGGQEALEAQDKINKKLRSVFFDSYKKQFRQPKEYR